MGRDILTKLGITLSAHKKPGKTINIITNIQTEKNIIKWIFHKYPHLCTRLGRSKNHIAKSIFKSQYTPSQHKGRRVPLHLLDKVEQELQKVIDEKQIIKLDKCSDELFISPVVITVKKDKSVKIALDSKKLNNAIHKNKYQMRSIDHLMDSVAVFISERKNKPGQYLFSKIDIKYAYSQIPLDENIKKHCNFNIIGGKATGTYRFINGFYGLTDMPATFQKTIDKTLHDIKTKFAYLDDILIVTKGTLEDHEKELDKIMQRLNNENLAINLQKCEFAKEQITWLGFVVTPNGVTPTKQKCDAIINLENPKTLKQLRSFMGCIHHLIKFIPNLARISEPLRPLLSKANTKSQNKLDMKENHTIAFNDIKAQIKQITENKHFDISKQTRVRCDASKKGLGACLEQKIGQIWKPIAFASRFLNNLESRYSTNELELLAVVWSLEHFKYYLYGTEFILQTDHQALLSALKENRGNKTYQSRLTRWVDRLLPFHFTVEHVPGKNMGFADYLSRNPTGEAIPPTEEDKNFVINTIEEFKLYITRNSLSPNGANNSFSPKGAIISTNQNTDTKQVENDVINPKHTSNKTNNAFCLNTLTNQSHINSHSLNSNSIFKLINKNIVGITTRRNPKKDTFNIPIKRRFRAPNKTTNPQMEQPSNSKTFTSSSTQTEINSNKGKGLDPLDQSKHENLFDAYNDLPTPLYRENFNKVFNEEFLAEASQRELKPIIDLVKTQNWDDLKKVNPLYFRIRRDLSVTETNCLLYDNRLVIPQKLKQLVIDTIHHKHPGQVGMLALAKLIWWPHIHSEIVAKAKACRHCIDEGKNLKPIISKNQLGDLPKPNEPNEEIQMDFAGPIPYKNSTQNNYILVTVDRLSRFPHAETFHNCDTETAIDYLEKYCKLHGIPRSIRCDQAQAFKAKEFDIFCKNKNIKLILAPAGDHRGTGMVERLIQTIKRRLAVLDIDPNWSSESLSSRLASIIENIRLIPNRTTKTTPFEAHFSRKPNTALPNMLTKPAIKNLSYHKLKSRCLDKRTLKHDVLSQEEM